MSWAEIISKNKNPVKNIKKKNKPTKIIFYEKLNSPYDNFNIEYGMDLHNLIFNYFNSIEHENNLFLNKAAPNKIYSFFENYINFDDFIENNGSNSDSEESLDN